MRKYILSIFLVLFLTFPVFANYDQEILSADNYASQADYNNFMDNVVPAFFDTDIANLYYYPVLFDTQYGYNLYFYVSSAPIDFYSDGVRMYATFHSKWAELSIHGNYRTIEEPYQDLVIQNNTRGFEIVGEFIPRLIQAGMMKQMMIVKMIAIMALGSLISVICLMILVRRFLIFLKTLCSRS